MIDNDLYTLLIAIFRTGLAARSVTASVRQSYQPRQQGTPSGPTILINKLPGNRRYGFLGREDVWDEDEEAMVHTETQWIEATFQVGALSIQDPTDTSQLTASDIVNIAASIIQSDKARATMRAQNVGILRVTNIRNPAFSDDKDRFEYSPSFDFTVTYKQVDITQGDVLQSTELNIIEV